MLQDKVIYRFNIVKLSYTVDAVDCILKMITLAVLVAASLAVSGNAAESSCKCWEGYKAEHNRCVAINQLHIMPCNMAKAPKCQCSGKVTSILKDRTGTWCTRYENGQEQMRWPCENGKEWDEFFQRHPDFV